MKPSIKLLLGGIAAALFSLSAGAQPAPAAGTQATEGMGATGPCGKARDPQRCEALQKAKETCKEKPAAEKRKCMEGAMPPMDCSKARNPQRCEDHQKAKEACKDKAGTEYRQCLREQMPRRGGKGQPKN